VTFAGDQFLSARFRPPLQPAFTAIRRAMELTPHSRPSVFRPAGEIICGVQIGSHTI
jgi:hypothetical protein